MKLPGLTGSQRHAGEDHNNIFPAYQIGRTNTGMIPSAGKDVAKQVLISAHGSVN